MTFQERFLTRKCFFMVITSQGTHQQKFLNHWVVFLSNISEENIIHGPEKAPAVMHVLPAKRTRPPSAGSSLRKAQLQRGNVRCEPMAAACQPGGPGSVFILKHVGFLYQTQSIESVLKQDSSDSATSTRMSVFSFTGFTSPFVFGNCCSKK